MLLMRVVSALVGIPVLVWVVMTGGWLLLVGALVLGLVAQAELYTLLSNRGYTGPRVLGYLGTVILMASVFGQRLDLVPFLFTGLIVVLFVSQIVRKELDNSIADIGFTVLGVFYPGLLLSYLFLLQDRGPLLLLLVFVATWAYDTAAYFVGKALGRHPLLPTVSPKKTVEGTIGGLGASTLVLLLFTGVSRIEPGFLAMFGFLAGCAAQMGDLAESVIKRYAGVKDSGCLIPGHGGVLDRFDGILFTVPLGYFFFLWLGLG